MSNDLNGTPASSLDRTWWPRFKSWWSAHHRRLISIEDSPHAIALGMAVGIFFGFTPLFSLKTLLSIGVAWLLNSNKVASAIGVTLHDVLLFFMPAIYWWEYKFGYWALHGALPQRVRFSHIVLQDYLHWKFFARVIWPTLIGSMFLALPAAIVVYFVVRSLVIRAKTRRRVSTSR